jgi:signal transduction histidine kinase
MRKRLRAAEATIAQFQKMETLGQLTAGVAHDFNNLLGPILNALEIMQLRKEEDPEISDLLKGAVQSAMSARALVRRLLNFARPDDREIQPILVEPVISALVELAQHLLPATIEIELGTLPAATVNIDANQLELALLNLAINARDAMPDGGLLTIEGHEILADTGQYGLESGRYLQLRISDNGCGMDADTAANATEPFFTTKAKGRGTGLGLSMTRSFALDAGGDMEIETAPGAGTTVILHLPLADNISDDEDSSG